jgi:HEAT repeat protein
MIPAGRHTAGLLLGLALLAAGTGPVRASDPAARYERVIEEKREYNRSHHAVGMDLADLHKDMATQPVEALLPLLAHPYPELREAAAAVIGTRPEDRDREDVRHAVVAALQAETKPVVLQRLITTARVVKAEAAAPFLTRLLPDPGFEDLGENVAQTLGELGDLAAVPALIKAADGRSEPTRRAALWALAQLGDPDARPTLRKWARATGSPSRGNAILGLGLMKDLGSAPYLRRLLHARDRDLVLTAIRSLELMRPRGAAEDLAPLLDHADEYVREQALGALLLIADTEALDILLDRYRADPDSARALADLRLVRSETVEKLPEVRESLGAEDLDALALALTAALPGGEGQPPRVTAGHVKRVWRHGGWYFVRTDYGSAGHLFLVRREGDRWLRARALESWIA